MRGLIHCVKVGFFCWFLGTSILFAQAPLRYELVDEQIAGSLEETRVHQRILVTGDYSKPKLRGLFKRLLSQVQSRTDLPQDLARLTVLAYVNRAHLHSNERWLAKLLKKRGVPQRISINSEQLALLNSPEQVRFGIPEATRRKVWLEWNQLLKDVKVETDKKFPNDALEFSTPGQVYQVREKTLLLLANDDAIAPRIVMRGAVTLPPWSMVRLLHSINSSGEIWYYVAVLSDNASQQTGWVKPLALQSQHGSSNQAFEEKKEGYSQQSEMERALKFLEKQEIGFQQLDSIRLEAILRNWPLVR